MSSENAQFVGVDLGGTNITVAVVNRDHKVLGRARRKTRADKGANEVVDRIAQTVEEAVDDAKVSKKEVAGVGVGAPGAIDLKRGVVVNAPNLRWNQFPLAEELAKACSMPVTLDNDVNVGAWGEFVAGAGKKHNDLIGIFVGTGIGAGLVLNGELYYGHFNTAGEIGHTVIRADAPLGRRTLENVASRTAVVNLLRQLIAANHPSSLVDIADGDLKDIRSKQLAQAFEGDDALVHQAVRQAARYVAAAAANAVTLLSLPCVVLGGGVTSALGDPWVKLVRDSFDEFVFPGELKACDVIATVLGDDAGPVGAADLARRRIAG